MELNDTEGQACLTQLNRTATRLDADAALFEQLKLAQDRKKRPKSAATRVSNKRQAQSVDLGIYLVQHICVP